MFRAAGYDNPYAKNLLRLFFRNNLTRPKITSEIKNKLQRFLHIYIHIYIYAVVLLSGAKFGLLRCYYLGQVCFLQNTVCQKHYKNRGFSTFFLEKKNCARKFEVLLSGPSWSFLRCSQLGPNNNTYLAQIITPQNAFFFVFFAFKICRNTYFYSVFEHQPKFGKKKRQKKKR